MAIYSVPVWLSLISAGQQWVLSVDISVCSDQPLEGVGMIVWQTMTPSSTKY